ncbi:MAG: membrane-bound lytic murein transglycosylase MltF [Rhodocyclaceae bacterium]|nr:membrane-bound lytic murein transglycosylase MltF [Rhodocyclaceae bacterium]
MGRLAGLTFLFCAVLLTACDRIETPEQSGELVVAIRNGPATYQVENGVASGFEHDIVEAFAQSRHLQVRYIVADDQGALRRMVRRKKVHFAASASVEDVPDLLFTAPMRETEPILVGSADNPAIQEEETALDGMRIEAMFASPQAEALTRMSGTPPRFTVIQRSGVAEFELLQNVGERRTDLAATDTLQYRLALQLFPDLEVVQSLPGKLRFAWAFATEDKALWNAAQDFIAEMQRSGQLARLKDRYFGHIERIKPQGITELLDDMRTTLPRYRKDFQDAQAASGIDWRLLAALAYQESKWDPNATSPTGVRGMMMLTEDTADRLRVNNRLDPKQSIRAGAKYLADLRDGLPDEVAEPDRTWLALAAYNLGMGHMNGARAIATGMKRDPNSWYEMKKVLPLMARPEVYSHLKSGRARGGEAVILVENIRTFYGILSHFEPAWQPTLKPYKPNFKLR